MPPKKADDGPSQKNARKEDESSHPATQQATLEQREGRRLNEISKTLNLILKEIQGQTVLYKKLAEHLNGENDFPRTTLNKISDTLQDVKEMLSETRESPSVQTVITTETTPFLEEEALKVKASIGNIWENKLEKRRDTFWNYVKNEGHKKVYSRWLSQEEIIIPKYLQKKEFQNEPEQQKKVRERAVRNDFETEIELQGLRAEQHQMRYEDIDAQMNKLIEERSRGELQLILKKWWKSATEVNEQISRKRWLKNAHWLE